ncbi:ATP-binding protein [Streptomyces sp. NPDC003635]
MNAREARRHERVMSDLDAFTHWFAASDPTAGGRCATLTLYAELPDTAHIARDMTVQLLRDSGAAEIVDDAELAVSELVGNVVNHAVPEPCLSRPGGSRRIHVTFKIWPKWVFIGVTDEDSTPPVLPLGDTFSPGLMGELAEAVVPDSGRGLFIVQRVAAAVWCTPEDQGGKTVWCRFDLDSSGGDARP